MAVHCNTIEKCTYEFLSFEDFFDMLKMWNNYKFRQNYYCAI